MLFTALAFLAGITVFQQQAELPDNRLWWPALTLMLLSFRNSRLRVVAIAIAGFLWAWWQATALLQIRLPSELAAINLLVEGVVETMPERPVADQSRFRFRVSRYRQGDAWQTLDLPVRISWYRGAPPMQAGEHWQLVVRLKPPHGFSNPGGFDYERWLFAQRIRATGYVRRDQRNRRVRAARDHYLQRIRQTLADTLRARSGKGSEQALLYALALGDRSDMSPEHWQVLRSTGTSHLLAISGLHVGLVAGLVFFVVRRSWSRLGWPERWPAPVVAAALAVLAAFGYAVLSGFQVPVQRALIMVSVWMCALLWPTRPDPWRVWALALWLVMLRDPLAVLTAGFWLSFGAVAWILFLTSGRCGREGRVHQLLLMQCGIILGLLPLSWAWFHEVSLVAPLANLVAIPWIGFLVMPLLLATMLLLPAPLLSDPLITLLGMLLHGLWWFLAHLGRWHDSVWHLPGLGIAGLLVVTAGVACLLTPRALPLRPLAILLLLPAFLVTEARPQEGQIDFTLLDVGQGLAAIVETRRHLLVYDTGPAWPGGLDSGETVIAPYLRYRGHRHIDQLVVSHADNDHRGGAAFLLQQFPVRQVYAGEPREMVTKDTRQCTAGQHWMLDGVSFEFLSPVQAGEGNNASCVLRIETATGFVLLLPGDIEGIVERQLVANAKGRLATNILVAPHHGSRTSSIPAFVAAVRPDWVLFATGYRNRFGFPKADVVRRYREWGTGALDTARSGSIHVRTTAEGTPVLRRYREANKHYWNSADEGFVSR